MRISVIINEISSSLTDSERVRKITKRNTDEMKCKKAFESFCCSHFITFQDLISVVILGL